jgi:DNA helicase II / ATP-dependent DNA helicase PcrA
MTIESLLTELNEHQRAAATMSRRHALVLAGAGSGKTKTIIARAAYLINTGTPAHRIQILTFTRRSSAEIVERVRMHLGDTAEGLSASTFHTWCMSLIRRAPAAFGCKDYSVIDRDDQLQLLRVLRGSKKSRLPAAAKILNLYSFARNTGLTLEVAPLV